MKKLIVALSVLCLFGIADARKCTVTDPIPLFVSYPFLVDTLTVLNNDEDMGWFVFGEMVSRGHVMFARSGDDIDVMHTAKNSICQVVFRGKVYYSIDKLLKCRW